MRMWMVDPKKLCRRHLLGEHVEMHMFAGTIKKGISIQGYIEKGLVNPNQIKTRHDALAEEMGKRGYCHKSPLPLNCAGLPVHTVDIQANILELQKRCGECSALLQGL